MTRPCLALVLLAALGPALRAAPHEPADTLPPARPRSAAVAQEPRRLDLSGVAVRAAGAEAHVSAPAYSAAFREGVTRVAGRAPGAELRLRTAGVRRGGGAWSRAALRPDAEVVGDRVRFAWDGFDELLEARREGLKQSFVFAAPPPGLGELVVRLALWTELEPRRIAPDGLLFLDGERPAVEVSGVVGIDAHGRRARGELRLGAGFLDLVLPADFVDAAAWPLVLDPLILFRRLATSDDGDRMPDIAWDADTDRFCVAWLRSDVGGWAYLAQVFEADGTPAWPVEFLGIQAGGLQVHPAVCNLNGSDAFVVCHRQLADASATVLVTAISARDGAIHQESFPTPWLADLDVGGDPDPTGVSTDALLVWEAESDVRGLLLKVPTITGLAAGELVLVEDTDELRSRHPRVSQSNGPAGRWLVTWEHAAPGAYPRPLFRSVDYLGALGELGWVEAISGRRPSCDGDGEHFLIAFERELPSGPSILQGQLVDVRGGAAERLASAALLGGDPLAGSVDVGRRPEVAIVLDPRTLHNAYAVSWILGPITSTLPTGPMQYRVFAEPGLDPIGRVRRVDFGVKSQRSASRFAADFALDDIESFGFAVRKADGLHYGLATP